MKKIIFISLIFSVLKIFIIFFYLPIFIESDISPNLNTLNTYIKLKNLNNKRPFSSNIDQQYFNKDDLNNNIIKIAYHNRSIRMNDDEEQNFAIAVNYLNNKNYSIFNKISQKYLPVADQHSFQVFIYKFFIKNNINFDYFIFSFILINIFLFFLSVIFFFKIINGYLSKNISYYATIAYCLYPSVFYYIGALFFYENIALSLIIINVYLFINSSNKYKFFIIIPLAIFCLLIRFQTIFIWLFLFFFYSYFEILKQKKIKLLTPFIIFLAIAYVVHMPILNKNYKLFESKILTTSTGYNFFVGANKNAKGSWNNTPMQNIYEKNILPLNINAKQKSDFYLGEALNWISNNPGKYILLQIKKIIIYFLPQNFSVLPYNRIYNPVNLIIHLCFLLFLIHTFLRFKISKNDCFALSPFLGSLLISIIFFTGYRWRYYAEPFMIILVFVFISRIIKKQNT